MHNAKVKWTKTRLKKRFYPPFQQKLTSQAFWNYKINGYFLHFKYRDAVISEPWNKHKKMFAFTLFTDKKITSMYLCT